jgi:hypothetical protein
MQVFLASAVAKELTALLDSTPVTVRYRHAAMF